jgi:hypothetical protein
MGSTNCYSKTTWEQQAAFLKPFGEYTQIYKRLRKAIYNSHAALITVTHHSKRVKGDI